MSAPTHPEFLTITEEPTAPPLAHFTAKPITFRSSQSHYMKKIYMPNNKEAVALNYKFD